jgi:cytochrome oxidase Cu insertion factor (SCO1/SenC/PrrC family)
MNAAKLKLTFILLAITVPITLATILFQLSLGTGRFDSTSNGALIQPVLDIGELGLVEADGKPAYQTFEQLTAGVSPEDYEPRPWQLLYFGAASCDAACEERLYFLRQVHIRLGAESTRVQRVYVLTSPPPATVDPATQAYLTREQADMRIVHAQPETLRDVLARSVPAEEDPQAGHYIYVMDPVGNIMLYFTPDNDAEQILEDLDRLLDHSSLG